MTIKVGDSVRYLNSKGGGTVTRIKSKNEVWVLEDDGFEVPARASELVVTTPANFYFPGQNEASLKYTSKPQMPLAAEGNPESITVSDDKQEQQEYVFDEKDETPEGEQLSIYLAFIPTDVNSFQTSDIEVYLVNDSNYFLNFQWLLGKDSVKIAKADTIEPLTTFRLVTLERKDLNDMQQQRFQAIAYKKRPYSPKPSIDISFGVRPVKFYKLHCFEGNDYFESPAMLLPLVEKDVFNLSIMPDLELEPRNLVIQKEDVAHGERRHLKPKEDYKRHTEPMEVDLHINQLLDSVIGMTPKDMFDYQIDKFNDVMRKNIQKKGLRIVFIHGKGDGVLRAEILKQIKQKYPNCYAQDASFQKYGFGATMVTIK